MIFLIIFCVICFLFIVGGLLFLSATYKLQASFVQEGTIEFVVSGEDLSHIMINVDNHVLIRNKFSGEWAIKPLVPDPSRLETQFVNGDEEYVSWWPISYLQQKWGLYWVSAFYPWKKILWFMITRERLVSRTAVSADASARDRVEISEPALVSNLRFRFPRPFWITNVETKDRFESQILLQVILEVVNPYTAVIVLKGKFFPIIEAAISSTVIDYLATQTLAGFFSHPKGQNSPLATAIKTANYGSSQDSTATKSEGLIKSTGIRIVDVFIEEIISDEDDLVRKALKAKEINTLEGMASIEKSTLDVMVAKQEKLASEERAIGNTAHERELMKIYAEHRGAAELVNKQKISENLGKGNLRVLAGQNTPILINPEEPTPRT